MTFTLGTADKRNKNSSTDGGIARRMIPYIKGSELNEDPMAPITKEWQEQVVLQGDDLEIDWIHRNDRFFEKLATPDTTVAPSETLTLSKQQMKNSASRTIKLSIMAWYQEHTVPSLSSMSLIFNLDCKWAVQHSTRRRYTDSWVSKTLAVGSAICIYCQSRRLHESW